MRLYLVSMNIYLSGYMPTLSEGVITQSLLFLDQSCLRFVPPYVIQKFDSHLFVDVIKLFYPMLFHWRYQFSAAGMKLYMQWWAQCLGKRKYLKHNDQIIRAH